MTHRTEVPAEFRVEPGASNKQLSFLRTLVEERDISEEHADQIIARIDEQEAANGMKGDCAFAPHGISKSLASDWISRMIEKPKKPIVSRRSAFEAGMYIAKDGTVLRCYLGQNSGRMLVKKLVDTGAPLPDNPGVNRHVYEYVGAASGAAFGLMSGARRMGLEEAKKFGRMSGTCCVCARQLDVPESVEAGIGPVCASRL